MNADDYPELVAALRALGKTDEEIDTFISNQDVAERLQQPGIIGIVAGILDDGTILIDVGDQAEPDNSIERLDFHVLPGASLTLWTSEKILVADAWTDVDQRLNDADTFDWLSFTAIVGGRLLHTRHQRNTIVAATEWLERDE